MKRRSLLKSMAAGATALSCPTCLMNAAQAAEEGDGAHAQWSYLGETGPSHWGNLGAEYATCSAGKAQSPIDLVNPKFVSVPDWIGIRYQRMSLQGAMVHTGHSIQVNAEAGNSMRLEGKDWELIQFHFHRPSEHTIDGKRMDMEIHFVHRDGEGNLAVLGVFVERARQDNPEIERLWRYIPLMPGDISHEARGTFNPRGLIPERRTSYRYFGSLTTPPCSENVMWLVLEEPIPISQKQIDRYRLAMKFRNVRPPQELNRRFLLRVE